MRVRSINENHVTENHKVDIQKSKIRNVQKDRDEPKVKDDSCSNNINTATKAKEATITNYSLCLAPEEKMCKQQNGKWYMVNNRPTKEETIHQGNSVGMVSRTAGIGRGGF